MRTREMFFSPWQAADYTGFEAIYELLASGEIAGEQVDGRWRLRKSVLDAWLDAEVSPEELEKLTTKMSRLSEEQARQVLEQAQGRSPGAPAGVGGRTVTSSQPQPGRGRMPLHRLDAHAQPTWYRHPGQSQASLSAAANDLPGHAYSAKRFP